MSASVARDAREGVVSYEDGGSMGGVEVESHRAAAVAHLRDALGNDAPTSLEHGAMFSGQPLEHEGAMSVFRFRASVGGSEEEEYYVVAGDTVPNYYPAWGLTPEEAYDLHLGTRFMLVMEVSTVPCEQLSEGIAEDVRRFVGRVAPGEAVENIVPAAGFRVEEGVYAISRVRVANEEVYVLGLDCPPGIYRCVDVPPHVVLRRHIGQLIRREAESENQA